MACSSRPGPHAGHVCSRHLSPPPPSPQNPAAALLGSRRAGSQSRAEWGGERGGERGERAGGEPRQPRPFSAASAPRAPPAAGHQITEAPVRLRGSVWGRWVEGGGFPDPHGEGKFLSWPMSPPPAPVPPSQPPGNSPLHRGLESRWPSSVLGHGLCAPHRPGAPRQGLRCRLGSCPSCSARPELPPPESPPGRARSPLPFSPLVSSFFCARRGGGRTPGGRGCFPAPTSRRGGERAGAQKAASAPLRPSARDLPSQPPQLRPPPGLPGGATARHPDRGAPGI